MRKLLLLATVATLVASPVFAQVKVPDYKDTSTWKYVQCGGPVSQVRDSDEIVFHEDYYPVTPGTSETNLPTLVIVVYQPVNAEVFRKEGLDKFMEVSREKPWLMMHFSSSEGKIILFEYKNGTWEFQKDFKSDTELKEYLYEHYKL